MTKIDVFSGFLGAGKTTLLKKMIGEVCQEEKLVLIENEFGEVGVDVNFLRDTGITFSELNAGCICCSMSVDFTRQLQELIEWETPERILIEPTGVGMLSEIIRNIKRVKELCTEDEVVLGGLITVVDAKRCQEYSEEFPELFDDQIREASTVIFSRSDETDETAFLKAVACVKGKNPQAVIVTTPWKQLSAKQIWQAVEMGTRRRKKEEQNHHGHEHDEHECGCSHHSHHLECGCYHPDREQGIRSWSIETPKTFSERDIRKILKTLETEDYGKILRAKGITADEKGVWHSFNLIPGACQITEESADIIGKIIVIGTNLDEEKLWSLWME